MCHFPFTQTICRISQHHEHILLTDAPETASNGFLERLGQYIAPKPRPKAAPPMDKGRGQTLAKVVVFEALYKVDPDTWEKGSV